MMYEDGTLVGPDSGMESDGRSDDEAGRREHHELLAPAPPFEDVEIDETFRRTGRFPGTVRVVVEGTTFWYVCSPLFEWFCYLILIGNP